MRYTVLLFAVVLPGCLAAKSAPATDVRPAVDTPQRALNPRTSFDGPALEFEFPGLHIGVAEYDEGPTGATLFYFPQGVMAAVDVRGGAPGMIGTDFLRLGSSSRFVDAISFAGGSSYGLAAATGAANALRSMREDAGSWRKHEHGQCVDSSRSI